MLIQILWNRDFLPDLLLQIRSHAYLSPDPVHADLPDLDRIRRPFFFFRTDENQDEL